MSSDRPDQSGDRGQGQGGARSFWSLVPWRNFRRVLFLIAALLAVLTLKQSGGGLFRSVLDSMAPPATRSREPIAPMAPDDPRAIHTTVHVQAGPAPR